ncbi:hypothetical protein O4159_20720 [Gordonia terrae]|uniref:hypothetical protein n=1 Tax=Gordonia hongkongensis TaxID=1701090 RepID=UPI0022B41340|nr:hypothetical protein [Gordonia terrae]
MTAWIEVLKKIVDGPQVPVQGIISRAGPIDTGLLMGVVGEVIPLYVAGLDDLQVWRDEPKVRVESMDGRPLVIFNGQTVWRFAHRESLPVQGAGREMGYVGPGRELLVTQPASRWVGNDFTTPDGPIRDIEYLGRPCWEVHLSPPAHKPHPMQLIVDQQTGAILQQRNDGFDIAVSFIEFTAGIPISQNTFEWDGPVRPPRRLPDTDDFRSSFIPSQGHRKDEHQAWFAEHVTTSPLTIQITATFTVTHLYHYDDDGSFDAEISGAGFIGGRLARRPRTSTIWHLNFRTDAPQAWSTTQHDWALELYTGPLDQPSLATVQHLLHANEPVTGAPDTQSSGTG